MLRAAAYCRVSTDKEDQANSFESQQRYFWERIAREPDWELQDIYADEGLSGTDTKKRTQFNRMLQAARDGKLDLILTKEVSRFARNTVDSLVYTRELKSLGVRVIFLHDNIDTMDGDGELRLTFMSTLAQDESRRTSARVKWGQTRQMERGVVFGGSLLGYDVKDGNITLNEEGAETVRLIFHKYLQEGKGSGAIARELREAGIPSSRGNLTWSASTVLKILKNEKYCGDLIQKKTYTPDYLTHAKKYNHGAEEKIILRDHHTPIIDRATWEAVQRELHRRRTGPKSSGHGNRHPLSGKIRCGQCGKSFVSRMKTRRDGSSYRRWSCFTATNVGVRGCGIGRQLRDDVAMDILRQSVAAVSFDRQAVADRLTSMVERVMQSGREDLTAQLRRLEGELERLRAKKGHILDRFLDQSLSKTDFQFANRRCDEDILSVQSRLTALKQQQEAPTTSPDIRTIINGIVRGPEGDDIFYGQLLDHMTVLPDGRVEVVLKDLPTRWLYE